MIIICDGGCGSQSPDPKKGHVANHWTCVRVWTNKDANGEVFRHGDKMFCPTCWLRVGRALQPVQAGVQ